MVRYMREACEKWLMEVVFDKKVLDTGEKLENFKKSCRSLSVENDVLMYKGRHPGGKKIVPTPEQVWVVLDQVHQGTHDKHVCHKQTLVAAPSDAGCALPLKE